MEDDSASGKAARKAARKAAKRAKKSKKSHKRSKQRGATNDSGASATVVPPEEPQIRSVSTAAADDYPFPVDEADHCETPPEAYHDIIPALQSIGSGLGKTPAELRIYDPYYCAGLCAALCLCLCLFLSLAHHVFECRWGRGEPERARLHRRNQSKRGLLSSVGGGTDPSV